MDVPGPQRGAAAVVAADMVGYSRLNGSRRDRYSPRFYARFAKIYQAETEGR